MHEFRCILQQSNIQIARHVIISWALFLFTWISTFHSQFSSSDLRTRGTKSVRYYSTRISPPSTQTPFLYIAIIPWFPCIHIVFLTFFLGWKNILGAYRIQEPSPIPRGWVSVFILSLSLTRVVGPRLVIGRCRYHYDLIYWTLDTVTVTKTYWRIVRRRGEIFL